MRVLVASLAIIFGVAASGGGEPARQHPKSQSATSENRIGTSHDGLPFDLTGLQRHADEVLLANVRELLAAHDQQVAAAARARAGRPRASGGQMGAVTGTCAEMAPAGWDPKITWRESNDQPGATNGTHSGCAAIADSHFAAGGYCAGDDYRTCWGALKAGYERGEFPDPWACTVESGCRG